MHAELERATITELSLPSGDWIQVFGPADPISRSSVTTLAADRLFEVEDIVAALRAASI